MRSIRYQQIAKKIDKNKIYTLPEAIKLAKETAKLNFDGSLEVHVRLGIDPAKSEQQVRGTVTLPHGTGKTKKIAAFVSPEKEKEAKEAGADIVGGNELIDQIKNTGKIDFDLAIATPELMPKLAVIAKILGPRGLMPSPKNETITKNLQKTINELKKGKINFKSDDTGNVHQTIGKISFSEKQLTANFQAFFEALKKAKPASAKGAFVQNVTLNATMGPGIKIAVS